MSVQFTREGWNRILDLLVDCRNWVRILDNLPSGGVAFIGKQYRYNFVGINNHNKVISVLLYPTLVLDEA